MGQYRLTRTISPVLLLDAPAYGEGAQQRSPHFEPLGTLLACVAVLGLLTNGRCGLAKHVNGFGADDGAIKLGHCPPIVHVEADHGRCGVDTELLGCLYHARLTHVDGAVRQVALRPQLDMAVRGARHLPIDGCCRNVHHRLPCAKERGRRVRLGRSALGEWRLPLCRRRRRCRRRFAMRSNGN